MAETNMNVKLLAHTQTSNWFEDNNYFNEWGYTDGEAIALTAIRTCYSPNKPTEILNEEAHKYFGEVAKDGGIGSEASRLFRHIMKSKHTSTMEHLSFTFAIEGVSRSLLAQLTRHRAGFSFSVQSQRYVRLGSGDRSGGMDYVLPKTVTSDKTADVHDLVYDIPITNHPATEIFSEAMDIAQQAYDKLREAGIPAEDARSVLPNAAATNLVMTANLTALLSFYHKRKPGNGAQHEIAQLAEELKQAVVFVEPWTEAFFEGGK